MRDPDPPEPLDVWAFLGLLIVIAASAALLKLGGVL